MSKKDVSDTILDQLPVGVCLVGADLRVSYWSKTAEKLTGFASEEVVGRLCREKVPLHLEEGDVSLCDGECPLIATLDDGKDRQAEICMRSRDGERLHVHVQLSPVRDEERGGEITGVLQIFFEVRERMSTRKRGQFGGETVLLDGLTSLPNRKYLEEELSVRLDELDRSGTPFGVLILWIEDLQSVRDEHGPGVADELIRAVAQALVNGSRPGDEFGRWGSDELLAVVGKVSRVELVKAAERLRSLVKKTQIAGAKSHVKAAVSIGGAVARRGENVDSLLERADRMLSESQIAGRNRVKIEGR
jgi:diguanylate cyclase (GGDEF)-like protein/PAS domain S-box-containing protein